MNRFSFIHPSDGLIFVEEIFGGFFCQSQLSFIGHLQDVVRSVWEWIWLAFEHIVQETKNVSVFLGMFSKINFGIFQKSVNIQIRKVMFPFFLVLINDSDKFFILDNNPFSRGLHGEIIKSWHYHLF